MNRMGWSSGVVLAALVAVGTAVGGCGSSSQPASGPGGAPGGAMPAGSQAEEDMSPGAVELRTFHRHHHVGFIGFALMSIDSLGVSPEQEAQVTALRQDLHTKMHPAHEAEAGLLTVIADGIAAGNIDLAKVDAATAKIAEVSTQMDDATNDTLNKLHAILNAPERAALADKVEGHWMIWQKANAEEEANERQHEEGGHIAHLAKELALTPDQVEKTRAGFTSQMAALRAARGKFDPSAAETHLRAFAQAFAGEQFDAKTLQTADKANMSLSTWGAMRMARLYEAMNPVLTPEQRTKLAALLKDHAAKLERK
jgi:Spy/CpxP family protein refolding chaperone